MKVAKYIESRKSHLRSKYKIQLGFDYEDIHGKKIKDPGLFVNQNIGESDALLYALVHQKKTRYVGMSKKLREYLIQYVYFHQICLLDSLFAKEYLDKIEYVPLNDYVNNKSYIQYFENLFNFFNSKDNKFEDFEKLTQQQITWNSIANIDEIRKLVYKN